MRILMMADTPPNPDAGASGTEFQTMLALRDLGHDVDAVWTDSLSHRITHANTRYLLELPVSYRNTMLQRLATASYDVVHVNQPHGYLAARALRKMKHHAVFVHRSHGFEPRVRSDLMHWRKRYDSDDRNVLRRAMSGIYENLLEGNNRAIARFAAGHIVSATQCKDFLLQHYAVPADRVAVIPQAAPPSFQSVPMRPMDGARLKRMLYVGQLAFVKAPLVLARAVELILDQRPEVSMTWVCDHHHHTSVRALFGGSHVLSRVNLVPWQAQDELIKIYDDHGLFLFPSFFEGFGKAFLEAMTRGLIVIASDNGGMRDVIRHGENGFLHETGSHEQLASRALSLLADLPLAQAMSVEARADAAAYSWLRVGNETAAFYKKLSANRH